MELEKLSKKELISEIKKLRDEQDKIWDNVKILIAKISHEFKTPLNSIIGFGELFKYKVDNPKLNEYITNVLNCSDYLYNLVQDMVDLTGAQYKPIELSYSIFNVQSVIEEIIKTFRNPNIHYTLIDINICADYTRFKQLVYNLISNAEKFSPKDSAITIITYIEANNFYFEITDEGDGIKKEDCEKIFEFFSQVSDDFYKRQIGSGIGLSVCKAIVNAHKGDISVKSELNRGSTFVFNLPIDLKRN